MATTSWELAPIDKSSVKRLSYGLDISRITASVLVARGIVDQDKARAFLEPSLDDLGDPVLEAIFRQLVAVRAEGVGQDELRARFNVLAMDICDHSRIGEIEFVETLVEVYPAAM